MEKKDPIVRAEKAFEFRHTISHIWNPDTIVPGTQLDRLVGLQRSRVSVVRLPPETSASLYHSRHCEEEWIYVLQGQGVIEIDGTEHLLGPGDFAGFSTPSPHHQLRNPFNKSLICLIGGERSEVDIADFPREGKRMFRRGEHIEVYDTADAEEVAPADFDEYLTQNYRRSLNATGDKGIPHES
jgi:uncharacterized cupin superfamily protein